jgi:ABC-type glutathione transport system ATPase component
VGNRMSMHEARVQAEHFMEMVGLPASRFRSHPFQLSGGQRQRAIFAMAFGLKPRLLIADEPTAGQDDDNRDHILNLLEKLRRDHGVAAILVSHDLRVLSRLAGKLVVIYRGKQVEAGSSADVIGNPGHPHTRELVAAMHYLEKERCVKNERSVQNA